MHFSLMVVTEDGTQESIEQALLPFGDFENTTDEYVQSVSILEDYEALCPDGMSILDYVMSENGYSTSTEGDESNRKRHSRWLGILFLIMSGMCSVLAIGLKQPGFLLGSLVAFVYWQRVDDASDSHVTNEEGEPLLVEGKEPDLEGEHKHGWILMSTQGELLDVVVRTNPNAQWDAWVVGGRYDSRLVSHGVSVNHARKGEIARDRMADFCEEEARQRWHTMQEVVGEHFGTFTTFNQLYQVYPDIEQVRRIYEAQPVKQAQSQAVDIAIRFTDIENFACSEKDYVEHMRSVVLQTSALLDVEGVWHEKGWGPDEGQEGRIWDARFEQLYDAIPEDAFITIVDCHM